MHYSAITVARVNHLTLASYVKYNFSLLGDHLHRKESQLTLFMIKGEVY